jgi:hypothetical protein
MVQLGWTFSEIYNQVSDFLGSGTSPSSEVLTKVKNIVHRAYLRFLNPISPVTGKAHLWSFIKVSYTIQLKNGMWKYALPEDFDRLLAQPQFDTSDGYDHLIKVDKNWILNCRSIGDESSTPIYYAIVPSVYNPEIGTKWEIWVYPTPNQSYNLFTSYIMSPIEPSATTDLVVGGPFASEVLLEMALAVAEQQENDEVTYHKEIADQLLAQLLLRDTVDVPDTVGSLRMPKENVHNRYQQEISESMIYSGD